MKQRRCCLRMACKTIILGLVNFTIWMTVQGQNWSQYDQGTPPQHAIGVAPLGNYISTDVGTINLSNGALNIALPLATVGGRGSSLPISLNYSSKVWSVAKDNTTNYPYNENQLVFAYADYGTGQTFADYYSSLTTGWTIGRVPAVKWQFVGIGPCSPDPYHTYYSYGFDKLTAVLPDGGEIELRDDTYDGARTVMQYGCSVLTKPRAKTWHATDGSGTIFIYDDNNTGFAGTLITGDGMRYRFDTYTTGGTYPSMIALSSANSITDRNGNIIRINHPGNSNSITEYVDQLGRSTTVEQGVPDPANQSVTLAALVTVKGYQGAAEYYKIKTDQIGNHILNYNHLPIYTGYSNLLGHCYNGGQPTAGNYLFPDSYCENQFQIDTQCRRLPKSICPTAARSISITISMAKSPR